MSRFSRSRVPLVTEAPKSRSEDIGYRERRYLVMMAVRVACFLAAILMVARGLGWWAAFPAVGAVVLPWFAVVFANGGREPNDTSGFQEYQPRLPEPDPAPRRAHLRYPVKTAGHAAGAGSPGRADAGPPGRPRPNSEARAMGPGAPGDPREHNRPRNSAPLTTGSPVPGAREEIRS
jgi:hypothetical protein